jgi:hypothetical protein
MFTNTNPEVEQPPPKKRFKFLSRDLQQRTVSTASSSATNPPIENDIANYISFISLMKDVQNDCGLSFWLDVPTQI